MRRSDRLVVSRPEVDSIIRGSTVCHLALSDDHRPYVVPLNFGYRDQTLYFHCSREGKKVEIIRRNPRVSVSFIEDHHVVPSGTACSWTTKYRSVIGSGTASIIEDRPSKKDALEIIAGQYSGNGFHFEDESVDRVLVIRVDIEYMTGKVSD